MARGEDTSKHPNRGVARQAFMMMGADMDYFQNRAHEWMDDPSKAPYLDAEVATFSPETLKEFGLDKEDK
jgi:hypothetical protein